MTERIHASAHFQPIFSSVSARLWLSFRGCFPNERAALLGALAFLEINEIPLVGAENVYNPTAITRHFPHTLLLRSGHRRSWARQVCEHLYRRRAYIDRCDTLDRTEFLNDNVVQRNLVDLVRTVRDPVSCLHNNDGGRARRLCG